VVAAALIGVLVYVNTRGGQDGKGGAGSPNGKPAVRITLGSPIRDAVLALEPVPDSNRSVSLHDLLGPNAPKSGHFTYSDGRRHIAVSFKNGRVTSVNESQIKYPPEMAGFMPEAIHITITSEDDEPSPEEKDKS
jgi:hypothetical protein